MFSKRIFVYGANERWAHGSGAARHALKYHGAVMGKGPFEGNSYGICTKDHNIQTLPLERIEQYVEHFIAFAYHNSDWLFEITPIGCGLAGYKRAHIAPMFMEAPSNCLFSLTWLEDYKQP